MLPALLWRQVILLPVEVMMVDGSYGKKEQEGLLKCLQEMELVIIISFLTAAIPFSPDSPVSHALYAFYSCELYTVSSP
jgi:hypothetical protein